MVKFKEILKMELDKQGIGKKGGLSAGNVTKIPELVIGIVIAIAVSVALYPVLSTYLISLNSTFQNTFTDAIAGNSGLVALVFSLGLGYVCLMGVWKLFMGGGK